MRKLRCLIVDDEPLARESLQAALSACPGTELVAMADGVKSTIHAVNEYKPDVLLLDIQMPSGGAFEVLRQLEAPPPIIFVTAYDQYAVRAFEVNACDYLLKPVDPQRLAAALARVREQTHKARGHKKGKGALTTEDLALLELGSSGRFVEVKNILFIQAQDKYTEVACAGQGTVLVRQTINDWQQRLPNSSFLRLDRGIIVNVKQIESMTLDGRNAVVTFGPDKHTLPLARTATGRLRRWIRTTTFE